MLNGVGRGIRDLKALRRYLGLDSGLASRLLRELEGEGLVTVVADDFDGRRRTIQLTDAGAREFEFYEQISRQRAQAVLERCPDQQKFVAALDLIANVLGRDRIEVNEVDPRSPEARYCINEYCAELDKRFEGGFDVSRSRAPAPAEIRRPRGVVLVAISDDLPIGCVMLRKTDNALGEIKRLWVCPSARGLGVAGALMGAAEKAAKELGVERLRLDTNRALTEALAMYRAWGWRETQRFNSDPYADFFFEKEIPEVDVQSASRGRPGEPFGIAVQQPSLKP